MVCLFFIHFASFHQTNNEQIFFFFFFFGGGCGENENENDGIRSPSVGTSKKNKKEKRERDLAKIVRGGVRFAKARVSVLSRRNPSSERNREEIKRHELRVTLRSERSQRGRRDGVEQGLLEERGEVAVGRDEGVFSRRRRRRLEKVELVSNLNQSSEDV